MTALDDFKYATIGVTLGATVLAMLPNNTGATLTYLFALVPILWISVGSSGESAGRKKGRAGREQAKGEQTALTASALHASKRHSPARPSRSQRVLDRLLCVAPWRRTRHCG